MSHGLSAPPSAYILVYILGTYWFSFFFIVVNSSEETVFAYQVAINNVVKGRSEEVYEKYKAMLRKIWDSRKWSVVCGLIPRYDVNPFVFSRMLGINTRLEKLCRREDVMYVDVWDHFNNDRSLFSEDGLHLNKVGIANVRSIIPKLNQLIIHATAENPE